MCPIMIYSIINYFRFTVKGLRLECDGVYDIETGLLYDYFVPAIEETKTKTCNVQKKVVTENDIDNVLDHIDSNDKYFFVHSVRPLNSILICQEFTEKDMEYTYVLTNNFDKTFKVIDAYKEGSGTVITCVFTKDDIKNINIIRSIKPGDSFKRSIDLKIKHKDYTTFDKNKEFHIRAVIKHTFDYTEILTDDTDNEIKEGRTYEFVDHTGYIFEVIDTTRTGNGSLIRISFLSMDIYRIAVLVTELTPGDKFKLK